MSDGQGKEGEFCLTSRAGYRLKMRAPSKVDKQRWCVSVLWVCGCTDVYIPMLSYYVGTRALSTLLLILPLTRLHCIHVHPPLPPRPIRLAAISAAIAQVAQPDPSAASAATLAPASPSPPASAPATNPHAGTSASATTPQVRRPRFGVGTYLSLAAAWLALVAAYVYANHPELVSALFRRG